MPSAALHSLIYPTPSRHPSTPTPAPKEQLMPVTESPVSGILAALHKAFNPLSLWQFLGKPSV